MPSVLRSLLILLPLALMMGCGEPTQEELLEAATEALGAAELESDDASSALAQREEELALAQSARDEAAERVREGERSLSEARAQVGLHATDDLLFRTVQQALLEDSVLADVAISAKVEDGVITLTGDVPSEAIRSHATLLAEGVPGVAEVRSQLTVPEPETSLP
jgi:osmotically-inducible protein OsmY